MAIGAGSKGVNPPRPKVMIRNSVLAGSKEVEVPRPTRLSAKK